MASITFENVSKVFPNGHAALRDLTLEIADGEMLVLVGPSGSGKSTALRIAAGLESPTSGRVRIDGRDVTDMPSQERDLAMVFQSYALYPHKTVRENLAFPLRVRGETRARIDEGVARAASTLGIGELLDRKPAQLSGGQRQRVALGRALVREPMGFLLDEPLSNLDPRLRVETRTELALLHRRLASTMIYVTHDQEEAMTLGTRIAVMHDGALQQVAEPLTVYRQPANTFVAGFIGSPSMNFMVGAIGPDGNPRLGSDDGASGTPMPERSSGTILGIRPHDIELVGLNEGDLAGSIEVVEPRGHEVVIQVNAPASPRTISVVADADRLPQRGARVGLRFRRDRLHLFDARTQERIDR